jgi:hypothetical protein
VPGALLLVTEAAWDAHRLTTMAAGLLFTVSTAWIGTACHVNGRRCRRTHCLIDGYLLPPLSVLGLLNIVAITSVSWHSYVNIFLTIVIAAFALECCAGKYLGREMRAPTEATRPLKARGQGG